MSVRVAAAVAASLIVLASAPAGAHEELSLHALTVLDSIEPAPPGLEVRVVHLGAPALAVRNETKTTLTVLDASARPFLRIGEKGVFANVGSPMSYRVVDPASESVPSDLNGSPRWVRIGRGNSWTWFDPRLVYGDANSWSVPMSVGREELVASGGFEPLEAHGHFVTDLDAPRVEGLEVRIAEGQVPALFVRNDTRETLHVAGLEGEPFLRIGPSGVWANVLSPSYHTSGSQTIRRIPRWADPSARPRWEQVSEAPVWAWLERRAATPAFAQERDRLGDARHPVLTWTTPMMLGDRELDVSGQVVWVPPHHSDTLTNTGVHLPSWWALFAVAIAIGAGTTVRRRQVAT